MTAAKQPVWDVVALGEALVEFNQTRPGEPQYLQGFGGDTSNAVIAAARAGARTAYLTRLGSDAFGQALLDLWAREGVGTSAVERDAQHPTGIYFVTHGAAGHEFSYLRAGSAASRMAPAWLLGAPVSVLQQCRILHVSGISLAVSASACDTAYEAMRVARAAGARVAFDPNLRLKLWPLARARACIAHAVSLCDIFLPGLDDMAALLGLHDADAIADWGHAQGAATVVVKLGAEGVLLSSADPAVPRQRVPGRSVALVDATGAGDCFDGNLLARLALGDDLAAAVRYANTAASLAVQGFGAVAPLPTAQQVGALL
ncbi:2-dehydro-3-deoxygluconokinase [Acidovorax sp. Root275]|uniref:sugar kinase n=1 Tax=Acidovorax sp. Root275 TaxID=1736508 RepID=UPI000708E0DA|nr:sugar kinase [Acidovorax sp. Root275]KRD47916.1 2-dehydro-3-deoxygluconokinase [Acidovorax sp. Root275]